MNFGALPSYAELLQRTDAPPGSAWSLFGPGDQLGTLNLLRSQPLTAAAAEVRDGAAFSLDLPSDVITSSLAPTRNPAEHHIFERTPYHRDEWLDRFYPQYGSQIDGLRHLAHPDHGFYNNAEPARFVPGDPELSIHHFSAAPIAGRGVLLDVGRHLHEQGRPIDHFGGQAVTVDDLEQTLAAQGTDIRQGDILLIRFGWLEWYRTVATPGIRASMADRLVHPGLLQSHDLVGWLWDRRISMVAGDNFALECWPATPESPFYAADEGFGASRDPHAGIMHRALIALLGMPIGELWDLDALASTCARDGRYTCLLTVSPLPIVGGVGSPANAMALR